MTDRLEEIKERWNEEATNGKYLRDVQYLLAEVERLRGRPEKPGEWKARAAVVRGVHLSCHDREVVYADDRPLAKAIAEALAGTLNGKQGPGTMHKTHFDSLWDTVESALRSFNAGEEVKP